MEPTSASTRVLLVNGHELLREGVRHLLAQEPDLTVVASVATGQEALASRPSPPPPGAPPRPRGRPGQLAAARYGRVPTAPGVGGRSRPRPLPGGEQRGGRRR